MANDSQDGNWILIVDDCEGDRRLLREILEGKGYRVVCVDTVGKADKVMSDAIRTGGCPIIAIVDYRIGVDTGDVFARRMMDIVSSTKVVMISGDIDRVAELPFVPDGKVIKNIDLDRTANTLLGYIRQLLLEPRRLDRFPVEIRANLWEATSVMKGGICEKVGGINELTLLTKELVGKKGRRPIEKFSSRLGPDKWVVWQVYPVRSRDRFVTCSVQTTVGCNQRCPSCTYWRRGKDSGRVVECLTPGMIVAQVYHMFMNSPVLQETFRDDSKLGVELQFTGEGDGLVNNLNAVIGSMWQLAAIKKPQFSFLLSSVGSVESLKRLCAVRTQDLPRLSLAWSVYSVVPEIREKLIPASKGVSIEKLADLWEEVGTNLGIRIRAVVPLFLDINDSLPHADMLAAFFKDRAFDLELIPGCSVGYSGHLRSTPSTPMQKVMEFRKRLVAIGGLKNVRIRRNPGSEPGLKAGLGQTAPVVSSLSIGKQ